MAKSKSSGRWKQRQAADPYVRRAQADGYRSRAAYKLIEIQERDRVLAPGRVVVDLGAAPGSFSQYAAGIVGPRGRVIAVDLLPMDELPGVQVIQGDFHDEETLKALKAALAAWTPDGQADLVMSDMAPNMSGTRDVDQPRAMHLAELALELATSVLKPGGALVVKLFQGEGFQEYVAAARAHFDTVRVRKPAASRSGNRETYLVARNFRL